jgi:hypothetical protein
MGYVGLLLNAPYKIDSMVWMMICFILLCFLVFSFCFYDSLGYINQGTNEEWGPGNRGNQGFRGV